MGEFYPQEYGGYPPATHIGLSLYEGVEQDFYWLWSAPPQEKSLVTTTTFIYRNSLHTRTFPSQHRCARLSRLYEEKAVESEIYS